VFLTEDLARERAGPSPAQFRVVFPYIAGDLYGAATTGDFLHPPIQADGGFEIDLNRVQEALEKSLEPTEFSLTYLHIVPAEARIARLAPMALQADGIEQVGHTEWVDSGSRRSVLLVYVDRAASVTGQTVIKGRALRYDVRVDGPGYVWIERQTQPDADVYKAIPRPAAVILGVTP
jgi:hypothetical protein